MAREAHADEEWDDLVGRLARFGIHYFVTGDFPYAKSIGYAQGEDVGNDALISLVLDLARSRHAHLRDALIALLLRHPEAAEAAGTAAGRLPACDPAGRLLLVSTVVAAALQHEWAFTLSIYLPCQSQLEASDLAAELGLPSPEEDYGRPCLISAADALADEAPFPFNYRAGWEAVAHRLLAQLRQDARRGAA